MNCFEGSCCCFSFKWYINKIEQILQSNIPVVICLSFAAGSFQCVLYFPVVSEKEGMQLSHNVVFHFTPFACLALDGRKIGCFDLRFPPLPSALVICYLALSRNILPTTSHRCKLNTLLPHLPRGKASKQVKYQGSGGPGVGNRDRLQL